MYRAHPKRAQLIQESSSVSVHMARRIRSGSKVVRTEGTGCRDPVGNSAVGVGAGGGWSSVMAMVLGLREEEIFRTIVGYL